MAKTVHQLKVTLRTIRPAIWRRLQVRSEIKLGKLHLVLQDALGWTNSHLHQFVIDGVRYGMKTDDGRFEKDLLDENRVKLDAVADEKQRFSYEYDFGDGWEHEILVERVLPASPIVRYPVCLAGKRTCPPEDCGGPYGYHDLLAALADKKHERHAELLEWLGGPFDAERFDLDETNRALHSPRPRLHEWVRS
ncbi:MAG TPA: plasmid pRiA4b ORF-3 family protein [Polyangia bacterium]|nr:plasmid pRiA4b ORF-3 family protein [Polyangia bacterium]